MTRSIKQRVKDRLLRLGPNHVAVRAALSLHARKSGYRLSFDVDTITIASGTDCMVLRKGHLHLVPIMLECYREFFDSIEAEVSDSHRTLNFSKPGLHRYKRSGIEFYFPGIPEDDSISGYTHRYKPREGDLVFDVGAHAGMTAYFLAKMVGPSGRVIAFEPEETNYAYLLRNIDRHGMKNVVPVKLAMDATTGSAVFNADGTMAAGLVRHLTYPDTGTHTTVDTISLVDACRRFGTPSFVKMDIEGAELAVIESSLEFLSRNPLHLAFDSYHRMPNGEYTWTHLEDSLRSIGYATASSPEFGQMFTWADDPESETTPASTRPAAGVSRREVISGAAVGLLLVSSETACSYRANSKVAFASIGMGRRGCYVATHMAKNADAHLAAICDIYPDRIENARHAVPGGDRVKAYKDFNELLAHPGIDAVLIATPVFLHPLHFEAAVKARKHIYCEKPAAASVAGVKHMMAAAASADPSKTIQFGFQQRFSPEYLRAESLLRKGKIGEVRLMMSYWILANMLMAGFAEKLPPEDEKIRRWEFYRATSGCPIVEQDCHGVDAMNWFAGNHPVKAVGTGGLRYPLAYGDWTSDHHNITYYYPGGIEGHLISVKERHVVSYRDVREQFIGSEGVLETSRSYYKRYGDGQGTSLKTADDLRDRSLVERGDSKREITIDAVEAFFKSIIDQKPLHTTREAAESTLTSLLGRMAYETGREVTWGELLDSEQLPYAES